MSGNDGNTRFLLHSRHPDGDVTAFDNSIAGNVPHTISVSGNAHHEKDANFNGLTAWYFDGNGDYLSSVNDSDFQFGSNSFTIDCWFRTNSAAHRYLLAGEADWSFLVAISHTDNTKISLYLGNGAAWSEVSNDLGSIVVTDNSWHHLAFVRNGDNFRIYIDGVMDVEHNATPGYTIPYDSLTIGYIPGALATNCWLGYIAEVRVSNSARWTANFNGSLPTPFYTPANCDEDYEGVLLIHSNDNDGAVEFFDSSVNCTKPSIAGDVKHSTDTAVLGTNSSIKFDGTDDMIYMPANPFYNFISDDFTIELFVRFNSVTGNAYMISRWLLAGGDWCFLRLGTELRFGVSGWANMDTVGAGLAINTWYHVAVCRRGTNFKIYVNGVSKFSGTQAGAIPYNSPTTRRLAIGKIYDSNTDSFAGYMSEIKITRTSRYRENFTPIISPFAPPAYSGVDWYTVFLLEGVEGDGSINFIDEGADESCPHTINNLVGNLHYESDQQKFSRNTHDYGGTADFDYINFLNHVDWDFSYADWTIDLWVYITAYNANGGCLIQWGDGATGDNPNQQNWCVYEASGDLRMRIKVGGVSTLYSSGDTITLNTWHHIACVRFRGQLRFYIDGVEVYSGAFTSVIDATAYLLRLGHMIGGGGGGSWVNYGGYQYSVRISNGIARWVSGFTVPSAPFLPEFVTSVAPTTLAPTTALFTTLMPTTLAPTTPPPTAAPFLRYLTSKLNTVINLKSLID